MARAKGLLNIPLQVLREHRRRAAKVAAGECLRHSVCQFWLERVAAGQNKSVHPAGIKDMQYPTGERAKGRVSSWSNSIGKLCS